MPKDKERSLKHLNKEDMKYRGYKGSVLKDEKQDAAYYKILAGHDFGGYSHDPDGERSGGITNRNESWWKQRAHQIAPRGGYTEEQYHALNEIADEDDMDHIRAMTRKKRINKSKPKTRKPIKKCSCKKK
jgi:hypothetical protein